jgi:hypothetical protein
VNKETIEAFFKHQGGTNGADIYVSRSVSNDTRGDLDGTIETYKQAYERICKEAMESEEQHAT